jgi:iron complex transport system substrate-binding protein
MAPSTTETLFALGLGDRVVGVTRYCDYPAATSEIAKVGGYVDPNYEAIVALRPDLTILLTSHSDAKMELEQLGIRTLSTPHKTVEDVHEAIRLIGQACDAEDRAEALLEDLNRRTQAVQLAVEAQSRPRVLICIGRDTDSGELSGMYMAGRQGIFDEIIEMAGGTNAFADELAAYPQVSAEGVIQVNPDVIVDLVSHISPGAKTPEEIKGQWSRLRTVAAVGDGQVHVIEGNHALRPGPRYIQFLEQLARLLHPDSFAGDNADG